MSGLEVAGLGGDNAVGLCGLTVSALVDGGSGDDLINAFGMRNASVSLLGGAGDDQLLGGSGRSVLLGGIGADRLVGGPGDDILIGGPTQYDADPEALCAILREWARTDLSYTQRVENLRTSAGRNGSVMLTEATVFDDAVEDKLTGAGKAQPSWVRPFLLDLAADSLDPNAGLQVFLPPAAEPILLAGGKGRR